jgi:hypothetical protein
MKIKRSQERKAKNLQIKQNKVNANEPPGKPDEMDPTKYFENRRNFIIDSEVKNTFNPYPHKFVTNIDGRETMMSIPFFKQKYADIEKGVCLLNGAVCHVYVSLL